MHRVPPAPRRLRLLVRLALMVVAPVVAAVFGAPALRVQAAASMTVVAQACTLAEPINCDPTNNAEWSTTASEYGSLGRWRITITNTGTEAISSISVSDTLDPATSDCFGPVSVPGNSLAPAGVFTYECQTNVTSLPVILTESATAHGTGAVSGAVSSPASATATLNMSAEPAPTTGFVATVQVCTDPDNIPSNCSPSGTDWAASSIVGQALVRWRVQITNNTGGALTNVFVEDPLAGTDCGGAVVASLANGASITPYQCQTNGATQTLVNTITASATPASGPVIVSAPSSATATIYAVMNAAPATQSTTAIPLTWTAATNVSPSFYVVWVSDGGGPFIPWVVTGATSGTFYGFASHTYSFYTQVYFTNGTSSPGGPPNVTSTAGSTLANPFSGMYGVDEFGGLHPANSPPLLSSEWSYNIVRGITVAVGGQSGYTLDAYGALHPFGGMVTASGGPYWPGFDIARGVALETTDLPGGYILDGWGGIHPFNGAAPATGGAYWPGFDIARAIALCPNGPGGYVLDGWGGIHPFNGAAAVSGFAYWPGWDIARGLVLTPDCGGGYTLDGWGGVHAFGDAAPATGFAYWPGWDIARGIVLVPGSASEGYTVDGWGGFHPFGGAPGVGTTNYTPGFDIIKGMGAG